MVYYVDDMVLEVVATLFSGKVNDVVVSRDNRSPVGAQYTLLVIRDHDYIKTLLRIWDSSPLPPPYLFDFAQNDELIYGFNYKPERKFSTFARGQITSPILGESISTNLIMECLTTAFPPQILYLILTQDNVQITKDNSIYFSPVLDLSPLDPELTETACTVCCATMILDFLGGGTKKKLRSSELILKKCRSNSYSSFPELYRDIKLTALSDQKQGIKARLKGFWLRNKDRFFHLLLTLCVIAAVAALIMLISQFIFGDIPLLRLFKHCFDVIGTEHLK